MCGIVGIIQKDFRSEVFQQVLHQLTHRGPDGMGYFQDGIIHLGHRRLAIQDLSSNAHQPMQTEDGRFVIVYNGELYNHLDIREELIQKGIQFNSTSDTETLLKGYGYWGREVTAKLNGMFAFAIYDRSKQELYMTRDRLGIKPLYYSFKENCFAFGSEIKSILQLKPEFNSLNPTALYHCLMLQWTLGKQTGFKDIYKVKPGTAITVNFKQDSFSIAQENWHKAKMNGKATINDERAAISSLEDLLKKVIHEQHISDQPIAYFLSGGIDSSLICAITKSLFPKRPMQAFCISGGKAFEQEGFGDDAHYAQTMAQQLGAKLDIIPAEATFLENLENSIIQLEELQADVAPLYVGQIAKAARAAGYPVMMSGTGADDLFSGYRRHQAIAWDQYLQNTPLILRKAAQQFSNFLPNNPTGRRFKKICETLKLLPKDRLFHYFYWNNNDAIKKLFSPDYTQFAQNKNIEQIWEQQLAEIPNENNLLNQMLYLEQKGFLADHNLNYTDKMGMAESVEIRVPYLDNRIIDFTEQLSPKLKVNNGITKYLLKQVAKKYLPKEIIKRPKTGFGAPLRSWIVNNIQLQSDIKARLLDDEFLNLGIFQANAIEQTIQDTIEQKKDGSYTILSLLAIAVWLRHFKPKI